MFKIAISMLCATVYSSTLYAQDLSSTFREAVDSGNSFPTYLLHGFAADELLDLLFNPLNATYFNEEQQVAVPTSAIEILRKNLSASDAGGTLLQNPDRVLSCIAPVGSASELNPCPDIAVFFADACEDNISAACVRSAKIATDGYLAPASKMLAADYYVKAATIELDSGHRETAIRYVEHAVTSFPDLPSIAPLLDRLFSN